MSRAPALIKYHGTFYRLAQTPPQPRTPHKRCTPDASGKHTHWNEKQKKCMPVPPELEQAMHSAHEQSMDAMLHRKPMQPEEANEQQDWDAIKKHRTARDLANQHGFHELGDTHHGMMQLHRKRAAGELGSL